jgi:hypothetical protein
MKLIGQVRRWPASTRLKPLVAVSLPKTIFAERAWRVPASLSGPFRIATQMMKHTQSV